VASAISLAIGPGTTSDPTKPVENAVATTRVDNAGKHTVRVQVSPPAPSDPSDPKPAVEAPKPDDAATKVEDKPAVEQPVRPSWLPEKFATPNALKEATIELAKKQGAPGYVIRGLEASESGQEVSDAYKAFEKQIDPNAGKPQEKAEDRPAEDKKEEKPADDKTKEPAAPVAKSEEVKAYERATYGDYVAGMLDAVGATGEQIGQEFLQNQGKLSDEIYAKFEKAGVAKPFLDAYLKGMTGNANDLAQAQIKEVKDSIGGEAEFTKLAVWAHANMTKEQADIYEAMTNSRNVTVAKEGVRMLKGWYDAANAQPPKAKIVPTTDVPSADSRGFATKAEMMAAFADPKYKKNDKAFHAEVEEKLKHTKFN